MSERRTILVVDDSPSEIRVLMEALKSDYAILTSTSGEGAINIFDETMPDLVLMDVNMSPMDGYETCSILHERYPAVPVIFVSGNTETEEILKGFDVGGKDYITKPIAPEILKSKVAIVFKQLDENQRLATEKDSASSLAKVVMSSAGDTNIILRFLKNAAKTSKREDLAKQIGEACGQFGLSVSLQVRGLNDDQLNYTSEGAICAAEQEILNNSFNIEKRFIERGQRLIINSDSITLFVKNMPDQDSRHTELKDYLLALSQSAHEINEKFKEDQSIAEQRIAMVLEAVKDASDTLGFIQQFQSQYKQTSIRLMDELLAEVETNFFSLGLTENQEQAISSIIQRKLNESIVYMEAGLTVDDKLTRLMVNLNELTNSL